VDVYGLFLIAFQARAADPRARLSYHLSAPIAWSDSDSALPPLRIAARGFGRFTVSDARLTDGVRCYPLALGGRRSAVLGRDAPRTGFPDFDWRKHRGSASLGLAQGKSGKRREKRLAKLAAFA
jgi:hypothetical protein